ncbi:MAG: hypothetical protein ACUBOA_04350 [Candidatus Loosdrechtia sp.]|uniref:hypothetical protein n=1 Tax=Candidatus Loosdrechtia sp. TaxID=3101272 RepID=UPI003A7961FC|nr:MAG: hypothetical protein QY305_08085 [Candidatus Jettenia sp. AMX2]
MNAPHHKHIETAFLQLSFAIKLWHFLDVHPIAKDEFDIDLIIQDPHNYVSLSGGEFHSYDDLRLASENNISIVFGAAAITLWEAIREHSAISTKDLNPMRSRTENLAALSYMLRCCFAHGTAAPVWSIRNKKYETQYRVGNKTIDLSGKDGQVFTYESIGGYETLWMLKAEAHIHGLL